MKPVLQLAASVLALGGLLYQATSFATDLAELPLKASVLAKPNVIFGMDDSGSMDSELMLYNNDGAFWWNYDNRNGWGTDPAHPNPSLRTITSTWFNPAGDATSTWRKMVYLFPNGTATGNRVYGDASNDHFAVMPTSEFAFLRWSGVFKDTDNVYKTAPTNPAQSPLHNPIYYNPIITYKPWAPAQLSSGGITPANATTSAVKSHLVLGGSTFDLTATGGIASSTTANAVFTALPGMTLPTGASKRVCNGSNGSCGAWSAALTADEAAPTTGVVQVAMSYFPATYWVKEECTVDTGSVATKTCTVAPDGSKLKRYEIKSGNTFPSGRSYADELQNFANWFQYYRKRKLMLAAAMGQTMETLNGMRLGVIAFNSLSGNVTMYDADASSAANNRLRVAGIFYEANGSGGTPTRETLRYIGEQYKRTDMSSGKYNVTQYACQRNNAFIVTDGFANASSVTIPGWDSGKSAATWGAGAPYETMYSGSLADLALRYYTNNPRTDLTPLGQLPATVNDSNPDLHMNTYGLSLGARGTLFLSESTPAPTTTSAWPNPSSNRSPTSVDDLWHATINARGKMYLATTPEETADRIRSGLDDMKNQEGAQSSVAVSSFNLLASDGQAYEASYNPAGWIGDLTASSVNNTTGVISGTPNWSAGTLLTARSWSSRIIFTSTSGGSGQVFNSSNIGAAVNPDTAAYSNAGIVDYLRGNRSGEGTTYRKRSSLLGAVINAEPVVDIGTHMVYLASGEGMLHAFDTTTGAEEWAFVPNGALGGDGKIGETAKREYAFKTKLDGTPTIGKYASGKLLVGGMGAAGRSYYALDVTSPKSLSETSAAAQVKWTFPSASQSAYLANMGYAYGRPLIVKTANDGYVALVTSGYDNSQTIGDGKGRMWMLNASTGAVIREFTTTYGSTSAEAGLAQIAAYREDDGSSRYVYGGDLLGNLWKFDLNNGTTTLLAVLKNSSGTPQPITTRPQLTKIKDVPVVMVATGRLLDITDFGSSSEQTIYAIRDGVSLPNARSAMTALTLSSGNITGTVDWTASRGWYLDLPAGQQVNVDPKFVLGWLHVNANTAGGTNCSQSANNYRISVMAGPGTNTTVVGTTTVLSSTANATSPVVVQANDNLYRWVRLNDGSIINTPINDNTPIAARKNAWREIAR